jgi:hypothetical protein
VLTKFFACRASGFAQPVTAGSVATVASAPVPTTDLPPPPPLPKDTSGLVRVDGAPLPPASDAPKASAAASQPDVAPTPRSDPPPQPSSSVKEAGPAAASVPTSPPPSTSGEIFAELPPLQQVEPESSAENVPTVAAAPQGGGDSAAAAIVIADEEEDVEPPKSLAVVRSPLRWPVSGSTEGAGFIHDPSAEAMKWFNLSRTAEETEALVSDAESLVSRAAGMIRGTLVPVGEVWKGLLFSKFSWN